jgi:hypothetical protein
MATATRQDVHRPGSPDFDPEAYELVDVYDLHPESKDHAHLTAELEKLAAQGIQRGGNTYAACGHCGQVNLRYVALLVRRDVKEWIFVGQDCLSGRFVGQTAASFQALRKAAELERAKQKNLAAWLRLCDEHPGIAYASYAADIIDGYVSAARDHRDQEHVKAGVDWALGTLVDIARKARRNGEASERQVAFVEKLWREVDEKLAAYSARTPDPEVPPAPEGKVTVKGRIAKIRWQESDFGGSLKMRVVTDAGWQVWVTVPRSLDDRHEYDEETNTQRITPGAAEGDRVVFTATLTRSRDDATFAYGSRPTKARIVARAAA